MESEQAQAQAPALHPSRLIQKSTEPGAIASSQSYNLPSNRNELGI